MVMDNMAPMSREWGITINKLANELAKDQEDCRMCGRPFIKVSSYGTGCCMDCDLNTNKED